MLSDREYDALVATEIMGNEVFSIGGDPDKEGLQESKYVGDGKSETRNLAHYTTDIKSAMTIPEKLGVTPFIMERLTKYYGIKKCWNVMFVWKNKPASGYDKLLSKAIVLAALKACNVEIGDHA